VLRARALAAAGRGTDAAVDFARAEATLRAAEEVGQGSAGQGSGQQGGATPAAVVHHGVASADYIFYEAGSGLAACELQLGLAAQALETADRTLARVPLPGDISLAREVRAAALAALGRHTEAVEAWVATRECMAAAPSGTNREVDDRRHRVRVGEALSLFRSGDEDGGRAALEAAIEEEVPSTFRPETRFQLAQLDIDAMQLESAWKRLVPVWEWASCEISALTDAAKAEDREPEVPQTLSDCIVRTMEMWTKILLLSGKHEDAVAFSTNIANLTKGLHATAARMKVGALITLGRFDEAIAQIDADLAVTDQRIAEGDGGSAPWFIDIPASVPPVAHRRALMLTRTQALLSKWGALTGADATLPPPEGWTLPGLDSTSAEAAHPIIKEATANFTAALVETPGPSLPERLVCTMGFNLCRAIEAGNKTTA
jgi:tetratricopeptide (TPR) repeat protein